jgi:hypothetical protein
MASLTVELPELHDPDSGRLDAQRIADYLDVPLTQLAAALGRNYRTLYKTPASVAVQPGLRPIKLSLDILSRVFGEPAIVRAWLNAPHPDLGQRTPLSVILEGHATIVAAMLQDAIEGIPSS